MRNFPALGLQIPEILLPVQSINHQKWAVIACDQYTSQPEYWEEVALEVGSSPSTLNLIFPEVFLGKPDVDLRIQTIRKAMHDYLESNVFRSHQGMIYVERTIGSKTRHGLILALDLEMYDFNQGSSSMIRATEGTILNRLPPRIKIREGAPLELPHILMLIDDPEDLVIGGIEKSKENLPVAYDFNLMQSGGHLTGRFVNDTTLEATIIAGMERLCDPQVFCQKYNLPENTPILLFASGDGNHSLATAKSYWEKLKPSVGMEHPARYALVEVENVHDQALEFEPIHRVLFEVKTNVINAITRYFGSALSFTPVDNSETMIKIVDDGKESAHLFGLITPQQFMVVKISDPKLNLPVGTLQEFLDQWMQSGEVGEIDYVHGNDTLCSLATQQGNAGFYLAGMPKSDLFKTVIKDGSLPRKTFSLGEAHEKRFYFEARKISLKD